MWDYFVFNRETFDYILIYMILNSLIELLYSYKAFR